MTTAKEIADGICAAVERGISDAFRYIVGGFVILLAVHISPFLRDDSDEQGWFGARSGFTILTDRLTGCQYLVRDGLMTPRLNTNGKQVCRSNPQ